MPALQAVPILGWGFARQTPITWAAWALVAIVSVVLFQTPIGLRLRGVGEQPDAAETLGVNVRAYRVVDGSRPPARSSASPARSSRLARSSCSPKT